MNPDKVTTIFSCDIFGGFSVDIYIDEIKDLQSLVNISVDVLKTHLKNNNFNMLLSQLQNKKYHIHDVTLLDIIRDPTMKIYICSHVNHQPGDLETN